MLGLFFSVLATVFVAEMGDKTQLMLVALSAKYRLRDILLGTAVAILVLNAIAVAAGGILHSFLVGNLWIVKILAAAAFLVFSVSTLAGDDDEENAKESKFAFAPLAIFCTFFVAELGDKTQLATITFGATNGLNKTAPIVWLASSIGLFAADSIGLLVVKLLDGRTPTKFFSILAFAIFAIFGFLTLAESLNLIFEKFSVDEKNSLFVLILCVCAAIFAAICLFLILRKRRKSVS